MLKNTIWNGKLDPFKKGANNMKKVSSKSEFDAVINYSKLTVAVFKAGCVVVGYNIK
jgi:hypothetical protein